MGIFNKMNKLNKDYNDLLEQVLDKKTFSSNIKNILLSMIYKLEISYPDYARVKRHVRSKDEFLLELKNQGANINSRDMQELIEEEFNKSINLIKPLLNKIMESEKLLNKYIYELYNLNPKDIEIIEKNLNN